MGIAERRQRQKDEVRTSILDTAWRIVGAEGWQSLSIRKIADAIEYSVPVIYDHFENKEAILQEFTLRGFRLLNQKLKDARDQFSDPARQLEAMAFAYWGFAFENKEYYQLMYGLGLPTCEVAKRVPELATQTDLILEPITALVKAGNNGKADPYLKFHTLLSMLHGLIAINMVGGKPNREEINMMVLKDFLESFLGGF
jgi:AcrR family transcriptional regulator